MFVRTHAKAFGYSLQHAFFSSFFTIGLQSVRLTTAIACPASFIFGIIIEQDTGGKSDIISGSINKYGEEMPYV